MRNRPRGFTLIEVMTVVALIGIISALAVSSWSTFTNRQKKQGAVKEIYQAMVRARQLAITGNVPVRLKRTQVTGNGKTYYRIRWEKLACDDPWGNSCPASACVANSCGTGGCNCIDTGPDIDLPPTTELTLPLAALDGLCFNAGTGIATKNVSGMCTDIANPTVQVAPRDLRFQFPNNGGTASASIDSYILVDPATGWPTMAACDMTPKPYPCP